MPYEQVEKIIRQEPLEDHYELGQELGRGKFAIVKRCKDKRTGRNYAAKFLRKRRGGRTCRDAILVEVDIMRQALGHQRIVTLHEVFESSREMIIILELASGGELFRMIAVDPLPEDKARDVVWQLLEGVSHLHNLSIVHLDLKPENILLERKGSLDIKIADFGLALQISPGQSVQTLVGTAEYVAPEILNYEPLSIAADLWSIGALTYALLAGYSPFQGDTHNETFLNVSMCEYDFDDEVFDDVSQEAKDFIEDLLVKDPKSRLPVEKCLCHPWIKSRTTPTTQSASEGLNSSTSSLDSALCLDSASSLEPSPCSSASSSFAPRPSARPAADERDAEVDALRGPALDLRQVTEKVSKLCTETQKAEAQPARQKSSGDGGNLDGSVSSISSSDSSRTLKDEEISPSIALDKENSEPPFLTSVVEGKHSPMDRSRHTSSGSATDEEPSGKLSRPGSSLRAVTPTTMGDVTSLAPETVEKLKKFERLKQRLGENKFSTLSQSRRNQSSSDLFAERDSSPPNGVAKEKLRKTVSHKSVSPQPVPNELAPPGSAEQPKTRSASPPSVATSRKPLPSVEEKRDIEENLTKPLKTRAGDRLRDRVEKIVETFSRKTSEEQSPVTAEVPAQKTSAEKSPARKTAAAKSRPAATLPQAEPAPVKPVKTAGSSSGNAPSSQAPEQVVPGNLPATPSGKTPSEPAVPPVQRRHKPHVSQARVSWRQTPQIDPDAIDALLRGDFTEADLEALEKRRSRLETFPEEGDPRSVLGTIAESQSSETPSSSSARIPPPVASRNRAPPAAASSLSTIAKAGGVATVPPATTKENNNQAVTPANSSPPLGSGGLRGPAGSNPSESPVIMRVKNSAISSARRQMLVVSTPVFDENLNYGSSPLQSPVTPTSQLNKSVNIPRQQRLSSLQSSLTHSNSTPDLSAILSPSKSARRHKQKEDSYVMDSGSSRMPANARRISHARTSASLRTSLLSGTNIIRSLSISGKHAKRNSSKRPGYKLI